tara:strand:- start:174 stop:2321 length:2148 start_codon:yes stop_codon:yes gene_type:complete
MARSGRGGIGRRRSSGRDLGKRNARLRKIKESVSESSNKKTGLGGTPKKYGAIKESRSNLGAQQPKPAQPQQRAPQSRQVPSQGSGVPVTAKDVIMGKAIEGGLQGIFNRNRGNNQPKNQGKGVGGAISGLGEKAVDAGKGLGSAIGRVTGNVARGAGRTYQEGPRGLFGLGFRQVLVAMGWLILLIILIIGGLFLYTNFEDIETSLKKSIYLPLVNSNLWHTLQTGFDAFLNPVTPQEIWYGEVDEHVDTQLGVFINRFEPYQREFSTEENVILFADIDVYGFEDYIEDLKLLRVSCELDGNNADVFPPGDYRLLPFESYSPECRFGSYDEMSDPSDPIGRSVIATFNADYDFNTKGYLKVYFVDDEEKRSLLSKGIDDLFGHYKIDEISPVKSVYTSGPVEVALSLGSGERVQPLGLVDGVNNKFLGITIHNKWEGKINNINLTLRLPVGVSLVKDEKSVCPFGEGSKVGNFNQYVMNYDEEIETFKTFRCFTKVDYGILEGSLKQDVYQFEANYEYGAEKKTVVVFIGVEDNPLAGVGDSVPSLGDFNLQGILGGVSCGDWGSLAHPVNGKASISSGFLDSRRGGSEKHRGVDFSTGCGRDTCGIPVYSVADGSATFKYQVRSDGTGYGYYINVAHGNGRGTRYAHLGGFVMDGKKTTSTGTRQVKKGQVIGYTGVSGTRTTGEHLHFEMIDPNGLDNWGNEPKRIDPGKCF